MITIDTPEARDLIAAAEYGLGRKLEFVREAEPSGPERARLFAQMRGMYNLAQVPDSPADLDTFQNTLRNSPDLIKISLLPRPPWWRRIFGGAQ